MKAEKFSDIMVALESGKTVARPLYEGSNQKRIFKLVVPVDGVTRVASWWHDKPQDMRFSDALVLTYGDAYEIVEA